MEIITYQERDYPTRTFDVYSSDDYEEDVHQINITIASSLLDEALGTDKFIDESEEQKIDDTIYFYVDAEFFDLDAETICLEHLDEPFVLITEY